jgi:serine/threonine protein kinase
MTDDLIGKKIGGYEIRELIGHGGMATVYRAQQVSMNRIVAIKVLPRQYVNDDTYLQRFHREVDIVAQLEHRNIVPVHDYGEEDGQPYIVMRYMSGGSVDDLLVNGPLEMQQVCDIIEQIAPALDFAHSKNVLHRDLKPSNVLMDKNGGAYLTDFGIARILGEAASNITTQGVVGTPSYMSPEQAQGQPLDNRSDIYSLGVMLFEMATGRRPFESDTPYSIAVMHVTQPPPNPRSINPEISVAVENVILTAMSKSRDSRPPDALSLAEALARAINSPSVSLYDTQPGIPRSAPAALVEQAPPPSSYVPPPPSSGAPAYIAAGGTSSSLPAVQRRARPRRRSNLLLSAAVGGLLGCGLLTLVVIVVALIITNNSQQPAVDDSSTLESSAATEEATAAAGRATLVGRSISDGPTATPPSIADVGDFTGQLIYASERENNYDLYTLNLETGAETRLTSSALNDLYPAVSPDGQSVTFISNIDGDYEIYLMTIDGNRQSRLTQNDVNDHYPSWSPDGAWIVYSSDVRGDGNLDLYRVRADGSGEPEEVYSDGGRNSFPAWRGETLVFTTGSNGDAATWEIARLNVNESGVASGEAELLTENDVKDWAPVIAPDGSIYYLTEGEGRSALAHLDAEGTNSQVVYDGAAYEWGITVSPDGGFLVFASDESGRDELYLISTGGANIEQITTNGAITAAWVTS